MRKSARRNAAATVDGTLSYVLEESASLPPKRSILSDSRADLRNARNRNLGDRGHREYTASVNGGPAGWVALITKQTG